MKRLVMRLLQWLAAAGLALAAGSLPAAATPRAEQAIHLPFVQRSVPAHPQADLLRLVAQRGFEQIEDDCGWEAGVLALGWAELWQASGDEQYWLWLQTWLDGCMARGVEIAHVNDIPLAHAAVVLHRRTPRTEYLTMAEAGADYLFNTAPRTQDGGLIHLAGMLWDDTLIVVLPFLLEMWEYTGEARYLEEAVLQVQVHATHLQDPITGLYHHAWEEAAGAYSGPFYWGRGNGWTVWAQAKLLAALPPADARRPALLTAFRRHSAALTAVQAGDGQWHTVVTRSDFYRETSATALISAGLLLAVAHGLGDHSLSLPAQVGSAGVWQQVTADGIVRGVSGPTGPMGQEEAYNAIPVEEFTLYGQGVVLLVGAAGI